MFDRKSAPLFCCRQWLPPLAGVRVSVLAPPPLAFSPSLSIYSCADTATHDTKHRLRELPIQLSCPRCIFRCGTPFRNSKERHSALVDDKPRRNAAQVTATLCLTVEESANAHITCCSGTIEGAASRLVQLCGPSVMRILLPAGRHRCRPLPTGAPCRLLLLLVAAAAFLTAQGKVVHNGALSVVCAFVLCALAHV